MKCRLSEGRKIVCNSAYISNRAELWLPLLGVVYLELKNAVGSRAEQSVPCLLHFPFCFAWLLPSQVRNHFLGVYFEMLLWSLFLKGTFQAIRFCTCQKTELRKVCFSSLLGWQVEKDLAISVLHPLANMYCHVSLDSSCPWFQSFQIWFWRACFPSQFSCYIIILWICLCLELLIITTPLCGGNSELHVVQPLPIWCPLDVLGYNSHQLQPVQLPDDGANGSMVMLGEWEFDGICIPKHLEGTRVTKAGVANLLPRSLLLHFEFGRLILQSSLHRVFIC